MDDVQSIVRPVLDNHQSYHFEPLNTIWLAGLQFSLVFTLLIFTYIMCFFWTGQSLACDEFYIVVYAHVVLWMIYLIADHWLKYSHLTLKKEGYLEFHEICNKYAGLPFYIVSFWNAILLVVLTVYNELDHYTDYFCDKSSFNSPINFITFLITMENIFLLPILVYYVLTVYNFNKAENPPDAEHDTRWMPNILRESLSSGEVGYRERCEAIDNMLEKQADLIRYYKEANEVLNRKVLDLTSQCRTPVN